MSYIFCCWHDCSNIQNKHTRITLHLHDTNDGNVQRTLHISEPKSKNHTFIRTLNKEPQKQRNRHTTEKLHNSKFSSTTFEGLSIRRKKNLHFCTFVGLITQKVQKWWPGTGCKFELRTIKKFSFGTAKKFVPTPARSKNRVFCR